MIRFKNKEQRTEERTKSKEQRTKTGIRPETKKEQRCINPCSLNLTRVFALCSLLFYLFLNDLPHFRLSAMAMQGYHVYSLCQ